jgi:UDP-N-acetyl-2-amino-2-deoxyglucuronate dehydrogenase
MNIALKKNFGITGVAGYIAPRHLKAIHAVGGNLVVALDPHDSVGVLDNFFPKCDFFTETERFDRHLEKLKRAGNGIDYLTICSPNYLHDAHIRMALRVGAHAICEKPLVLNPWNLDLLEQLEQESKKKIYNVLQLRLHPKIVALKNQYQHSQKRIHIKLDYITTRGNWYHYSWKGNTEKSGGLASNIGIHFFDMLIWIFGEVQHLELLNKNNKTVEGKLILKNADVSWLLSIDEMKLPHEAVSKGQKTYRKLTIENHEIEFSDGFTDLHTDVYTDILNGGGFGVADVRPSIELVSKIRDM